VFKARRDFRDRQAFRGFREIQEFRVKQVFRG
jgi:hypothetical protein